MATTPLLLFFFLVKARIQSGWCLGQKFQSSEDRYTETGVFLTILTVSNFILICFTACLLVIQGLISFTCNFMYAPLLRGRDHGAGAGADRGAHFVPPHAVARHPPAPRELLVARLVARAQRGRHGGGTLYTS